MLDPPAGIVEQHGDEHRHPLQDYSASNDGLAQAVLPVRKRQTVLVDQTSSVHAVVQVCAAGAVLDAVVPVQVPYDKVRLVVRCVNQDTPARLVLEQHGSQRGIHTPAKAPAPTRCTGLGEQNLPVPLQHLHGDTVRLRTPVYQTPVVRVAHKHVREQLLQLSEDRQGLLQLSTGAVQVRVAVVEAQGVRVHLIPQIHHEVRVKLRCHSLQEPEHIRVVVRDVLVRDYQDTVSDLRQVQVLTDVVIRLRLYEGTQLLQLSIRAAEVPIVVYEYLAPVPDVLAGHRLAAYLLVLQGSLGVIREPLQYGGVLLLREQPHQWASHTRPCSFSRLTRISRGSTTEKSPSTICPALSTTLKNLPLYSRHCPSGKEHWSSMIKSRSPTVRILTAVSTVYPGTVGTFCTSIKTLTVILHSSPSGVL